MGGRGAPHLEPTLWLFIRLAIGVEWLRGGWEKLGDPGWTAAPVGSAVEGFLNGAIAKSTAGRYPEVPHWFHNLATDVLLPNSQALAYLVVLGELLVGLGLILGGLTRVAALGGVTMNMMFLWSGTSATNPPMLLLGLAIVLLGSRAGEYGLDRWLAPALRSASLVARTGGFVAAVAAVVLVGWLALIATDARTWLAAALIAGATGTLAVLRAPRGRGTDVSGGTCT